MSQRFRIRADVDDLWQTVQPGPFSEKQPQWLTLQLCLVTVGVTEWIDRRKLTPGSVLGPLRGRNGKTRGDDDDDDDDDGGGGGGGDDDDDDDGGDDDGDYNDDGVMMMMVVVMMMVMMS